MAELCSLDDAFPNIGSAGPPSVSGHTKTAPTREERRAARKKAKQLKGGVVAEEEDTDPDRLVSRMEVVEKEGFNGPKLPKIPNGPPSSSNYPAYFGKGMDDEEGFSSFSTSTGDDPNYRLEPDITKTFDTKGVEKAMGALLPDPNLSDRWKPMTETTYTAFGAPRHIPTAIGAKPGWASIPQLEEPAPLKQLEPLSRSRKGDESWLSKADKDDILERMNVLVGRLDQMEQRRLQNTQTELLLFVGTGVMLLFTFELVSR